MRLLMILMVLLPGLFQQPTEEPMPEPEYTVMVQNIEFVKNDPFTIRITGVHTNGCDLPLVIEQHVQGNVIFVELTQDETEEGTCVSEEVPFETEVELDMEDVETVESVDFQQAVIANNMPVGFFYGEEGDTTQEPAIVPLFASPVMVEDVEITPAEEGFEVHVRGQLPDGCEGQIVVRQLVNEDEATVEVQVVRLLSIAAMCPMMVVVYDETLLLETEDALSGIYTVNVNDVEVVYDFDSQTQYDTLDVTRFYTVIDLAEVAVMESFPPQLSLRVVGYQPDGCQFPVQTEVREEDGTIYVEIFRNVPNNVRCARDTVPYEDTIPLGSFEPGEYTININDGMRTIEISL